MATTEEKKQKKKQHSQRSATSGSGSVKRQPRERRDANQRRGKEEDEEHKEKKNKDKATRKGKRPKTSTSATPTRREREVSVSAPGNKWISLSWLVSSAQLLRLFLREEDHSITTLKLYDGSDEDEDDDGGDGYTRDQENGASTGDAEHKNEHKGKGNGGGGTFHTLPLNRGDLNRGVTTSALYVWTHNVTHLVVRIGIDQLQRPTTSGSGHGAGASSTASTTKQYASGYPVSSEDTTRHEFRYDKETEKNEMIGLRWQINDKTQITAIEPIWLRLSDIDNGDDAEVELPAGSRASQQKKRKPFKKRMETKTGRNVAKKASDDSDDGRKGQTDGAASSERSETDTDPSEGEDEEDREEDQAEDRAEEKAVAESSGNKGRTPRRGNRPKTRSATDPPKVGARDEWVLSPRTPSSPPSSLRNNPATTGCTCADDTCASSSSSFTESSSSWSSLMTSSRVLPWMVLAVIFTAAGLYLRRRGKKQEHAARPATASPAPFGNTDDPQVQDVIDRYRPYRIGGLY